MWKIWQDKHAQVVNAAADWVGQLGPGVPAGFLYGCKTAYQSASVPGSI